MGINLGMVKTGSRKAVKVSCITLGCLAVCDLLVAALLVGVSKKSLKNIEKEIDE